MTRQESLLRMMQMDAIYVKEMSVKDERIEQVLRLITDLKAQPPQLKENTHEGLQTHTPATPDQLGLDLDRR